MDIIVQNLAAGTAAETFVHYVYRPALLTHIASGVACILSGASALTLPKGSAWHRTAGQVFAVGMLLIGVTGPFIAESHIAILTPILSAYFVATGWRSIRRTDQQHSKLFETTALLVVLGLAAGFLSLARKADASHNHSLDGFPASFHYTIGAIALVAAALDVNLLLRRRFAGAQRMSRHLSRMCVGLLFAGMSFFFGQRDRFPLEVRQSGVLTFITVAPLALMVFWFVRVRFLGRVKFHPAFELAGRTICAAYLLCAALGLLALLRPRGL